MNDRRFIELLNLYVDQELSEGEARELELEIAKHPDRRRVYGQYCRMQRACVKLLEQQEAPAPRLARITREAATPQAAEPAIILQLPELIQQRARRRRNTWATWSSASLAAAACVALTFAVLRQPAGVTGSPVAVSGAPETIVATTATETEAAPDVVPAATVAAPVESRALLAESTPAYRPVLSVNVLLRPNGTQVAQGSGLTLEEPGLDWLQQLKLTPIRQIPYEPMPFQSTGGLRAADGSDNDRMDGSMPAHLITFEFRR